MYVLTQIPFAWNTVVYFKFTVYSLSCFFLAMLETARVLVPAAVRATEAPVRTSFASAAILNVNKMWMFWCQNSVPEKFKVIDTCLRYLLWVNEILVVCLATPRGSINIPEYTITRVSWYYQLWTKQASRPKREEAKCDLAIFISD